MILTDAEVLARARAGDAEGLVRAYADDVYRTAYRVLGDADLAADARQDAFVSAIAGLSGFRGDASVRTWLVGIEAAASAAASGPRLDERVATRAEVARAQRALEKLPQKQRLCVSLRIQEDLSYAEIGGIVGCSEAAARVNYHYGVQRLREVLGDDDAM